AGLDPSRGFGVVPVVVADGDVRVRKERRVGERDERKDGWPEARAEPERYRDHQPVRKKRERRKRSSDIRDVDRDEAGTVGVAKVERDGHGDEESEDHGDRREFDVLEDTDWDAVRTLPVCGIRQLVDEIAE